MSRDPEHAKNKPVLVPKLGIDYGKLNRDEEWQREVGVMLHSIELSERVGTSGDDVQVSLQYVWDAAEVRFDAPKIEAVDGKVTPAGARAFHQWEATMHPVWKLTVVEDLYDEAAGAPIGNPVAVVQITERRLEDVGRRLWLHPWYRKLMGLDLLSHVPQLQQTQVARRTARMRRRVEADLAARDD